MRLCVITPLQRLAGLKVNNILIINIS